MTDKLLTLLAQINVDPSELEVPQATDTTAATIESTLSFVFGVMGGVAVIIIILAGIQYMLSQADPQKTAKAKNTIIYAIVGLVVIIFAQAIVSYVVVNT